ncbi:Berardinelli-Seip congenital lipodystrophy 2 (seipin) [Linnemannia zychae]|nr:Berardinelli-Seip congenital lipodystrophy 2 (seipin) [Linnemannia zychae]
MVLLEILRGEQAYDVSMKLVMPTSSSNVALGNFMVMVQLIGANGHVIITSSRSAIVTYESLLLRLLRTVWRAIPLVLRWTRESQTIRLPLIENFVESSSNPVAMALIEISNPNLQIYRTSLHIDAHFQGLRYFMYYYRVTTALIFMTAFIFWEIIFCILTWQTISAWIVGPATQALATMPRPMLHNSHDNLPPIRRGDQPQLQQYHYSLHDTDNDDSEDDFLIVNNSSSSRKEYSMETVAPTTERNVNTRHRPTPRRRNEQEDSDSAASDADSIFDAIVPQQRDIGASSSVARVPSAQLRSRKT